MFLRNLHMQLCRRQSYEVVQTVFTLANHELTRISVRSTAAAMYVAFPKEHFCYILLVSFCVCKENIGT